MSNTKHMSIIFPIKIEDIFRFDFIYSSDPKILFPIMDLMKKNICPELLGKFIKRNNNYTSISQLLLLIPFSKLLEWYYDSQIMMCYWSNDLINKLCNTSHQKLIIKIRNGDYYDDELVNLIGKFNMHYNFMPNIIMDRIKKFKDKYNINIIDFYAGTSCIELFGCNKLFKEVYYENMPYVIKLYPKIEKIMKEYGESKFNPNLVMESGNIIFEIILEKYTNHGSIVTDMDEDGIFELYETYANILCRPSYYQKFSNNIFDANKVNSTLDQVTKSLSTIIIKKIGSIKLKDHENNKEIIRSCSGKCYVCKKFFHQKFIVETYVDMCLACGRFNYEMREMTADLSTVKAFVTGIRVKIGYATTLKLLRCGSTVVGTTRYPHAALINFQKEKDYDTFKNRLTIIKCNFLNLREVYNMLDIVIKCDINLIINNACQTVRTSLDYFKKINLIEKEASEHSMLLQYNATLSEQQLIHFEDEQQIIEFSEKFDLNQFNDIKDVKHSISWDQEIDQIDPSEIVEVVCINQLVPTLIINKLKGEFNKLMGPKFIINITALEGQFNYSNKNNKHLHTNMCKAAMNMMIRTLSEDPDQNLYVYCIDPGYVSGVCPQLDHYPVSMHDGASRIVYPILRYFNGDPLPKKWIKLRNFEQAEW